MALYTKSLIAYFDILGFREIVRRATNPEEVAQILRAFTRLSEPQKSEVEAWGLTFNNFSDLAVRTVPIKPRSGIDGPQGLLLWELLDLAYIQANLIENSVLIRGAVTVGDIYVRDRLIFGPGLVRAYELEQSVALFPRIILDSRVFDRLEDTLELRTEALGDEKRRLSDLLSRDSDNVWFVDYLRAKERDVSDGSEYLKFLKLHKRVIIAIAARSPELDSRAAKLGWMANYHNRTVLRITDDEFTEFGTERTAFLVSDDEVRAKQISGE